MTRGVIRQIEPNERLTIEWDDGAVLTAPWIWVREHSHDPDTFHPVTQQRQVFTAGLDPDLGPAEVTVDGDRLVVTWTNGDDPSVLPLSFAREHADAAPDLDEPLLWDRGTILDRWPSIPHDEVLAGDDGMRRWLDLVARYGFCMVTGTPPTVAATRALMERVGYIRETIFGGFWEFQPDLSKADTAYTNIELLPHTDGTYSNDAPGLQILQCLRHDGDGGASTMVDGFRIADELRTRSPEHYDTLSTVEVPGQYVGDGAHLVARRPVFRHDGAGRLVQVSFNNADRAPFLLPPDEMDRFYDALRAFEALANDDRLQWRRRNPPGEAMLFDNWRVLHGRTAFTGHRHLCGGYVNREDYESRRRVLGSGVGGNGDGVDVSDDQPTR